MSRIEIRLRLEALLRRYENSPQRDKPFERERLIELAAALVEDGIEAALKKAEVAA